MKIVTIIGARPQFIKAAVVSRIINNRSKIKEVIIHTGQHFDSNMSKIFFDELMIPKPNINLDVGGGTHGQNTGKMIEKIEKELIKQNPDWVLVYGDTDSTLAGALSAVKLNIPIAHVEAGLRSYNRAMPEEINRVLTDHISNLLFVPTLTSVKNLKKEGIYGKKVIQVGDVMLDAVKYYKKYLRNPLKSKFNNLEYILCTFHRVENTDNKDRLNQIIKILNKISIDKKIILPLHPRTKKALQNNKVDKLNPSILVIKPLGYLEMNWLISNCDLVITDSGGVQKEAYFHNKPCVILRSETEWVELLDYGHHVLLDTSDNNFYSIISNMYKKTISSKLKLFGDGNAGELIIDSLFNFKKL